MDNTAADIGELHTNTDKGIIQMFKMAASSPNNATLLDISVKINQLSSECIRSCLNASVMTNLLMKIINTAVIGELPHQEKDQYGDEDFTGTAVKTEAVLNCFESLFNHLESMVCLDSAGHCCINTILPSLFILLTANMSPAAWNSDTVVEKSTLLSRQILKLYDCKDIGQILDINMDSQNHDLISPSSSLFGKYLCLVKPYLDKEKWKRNPFVKASFTCMLTYTKPSSVSDHLADVLPPSLNFVDDFVIENKITGMHCLSHIVASASAEELRWYGRAEVVYEAVKHQLYTKNAALLQIVVPTLLAIVKVVERTPDNIHSNQALEINRFDEIFQMLLHDAEMENNIHIRRALTSNLSVFVDEMGIQVVRYMQNVVHLVSNFLEICDGPEETSRLNALKLMASLIRNAWPRVFNHCEDILKCLLKFMYDLAVDETSTRKEVKDNLNQKCVYCLILLRYCCSDIVESYLKELNRAETVECIRETVVQVLKADVPHY